MSWNTHERARKPHGPEQTAWFLTRCKNARKSPKVFLNDPGLAVLLAGYYQLEDLRRSREHGAFFETMIYHHPRLLTRVMVPAGRLDYWRARERLEVDFVIGHGRSVIANEAKSPIRPGDGDAAGLKAFLDPHPSASAGLPVHTGPEITRLGEKPLAIPWTLPSG